KESADHPTVLARFLVHRVIDTELVDRQVLLARDNLHLPPERGGDQQLVGHVRVAGADRPPFVVEGVDGEESAAWQVERPCGQLDVLVIFAPQERSRNDSGAAACCHDGAEAEKDGVEIRYVIHCLQHLDGARAVDHGERHSTREVSAGGVAGGGAVRDGQDGSAIGGVGYASLAVDGSLFDGPGCVGDDGAGRVLHDEVAAPGQWIADHVGERPATVCGGRGGHW